MENDLYLGFSNDTKAMDRGRELVQEPMQPGNHLLFRIKKAGTDNYSYTIQSINSGMYLDVYSYETADGSKVVQWEKSGGKNQEWRFKTMPNGTVAIIGKHANKRLELVGDNPWWSGWGQPFAISSDNRQTFKLMPEKEFLYEEEIYIGDLQLTVPKGGDLDFYGNIWMKIEDKDGNTYYRYYRMENDVYKCWLMSIGESGPLDMNRLRSIQLDNKLSMKLKQHEVQGAKIKIFYRIIENDADVAGISPFTTAQDHSAVNPNGFFNIPTNIQKSTGADDFYSLKSVLNPEFPAAIDGNIQTINLQDLPSFSRVHVFLQDEDGSDNFIDVYFTITRKKVFLNAQK